MRTWILLCGVVAFAACDCDSSSSTRRSCVDGDAPAGCGSDCSAASCAAGLYCAGDLTCSFDCVPGARDCGGGFSCDATGQCVGETDGGGDADVPEDASSGDAAPSDAAGSDASDACATISLSTDPTIPNIMLLVDRSSSMNQDFVNTGGSANDEESRWDALRRVVFAADGPIAATAGAVRYGVGLYTRVGNEVGCGDPLCPLSMCVGDTDNCPGNDLCLRCPSPSCLTEGNTQDSPVIRINPALDQFSAVRQTLVDFGPRGGTPTGDSIDYIRPDLQALAQSSGEPTLIILATDGEPDRCEDRNENNDFGVETSFDGPGVLDGMEESLLATQTAFNAGIRTFIISLSDQIDNAHLQQMANVGLGLAQNEPEATQGRFYLAEDTDGLRAAIQEIVAGEVSCELTLSSPIQASEACQGEVRYNGALLACQPSDENGWFPGAASPDGSTTTIELRGTACETYQRDGGTLEGAFPCFVVLI